MNRRKQALQFAKKYGVYAAIGFFSSLVASLLTGTPIEGILLAIGLILVASFSTFYFNYVSAPVNLELVKLSTIVMAFNYGILAGLIVGITSTLIGKVLIGRIDDKLPISIAAISVVAILAGVLSGGNLIWVGVALVGLYNVIMFGISMAMGGDLGWNIPYEGTSFAFNFILFTRIVPLFM